MCRWRPSRSEDPARDVYRSPPIKRFHSDVCPVLVTKVITGDATNEQDIKHAYEGVDTVGSAVSRNAPETQTELIRLAKQSPSVR